MDIKTEMKSMNHKEKRNRDKIGCKFIRINPDKEHFNISKAKNKIFRHMKNKMINDPKKITKMVKQLCI